MLLVLCGAKLKFNPGVSFVPIDAFLQIGAFGNVVQHHDPVVLCYVRKARSEVLKRRVHTIEPIVQTLLPVPKAFGQGTYIIHLATDWRRY